MWVLQGLARSRLGTGELCAQVSGGRAAKPPLCSLEILSRGSRSGAVPCVRLRASAGSCLLLHSRYRWQHWRAGGSSAALTGITQNNRRCDTGNPEHNTSLAGAAPPGVRLPSEAGLSIRSS